MSSSQLDQRCDGRDASEACWRSAPSYPCWNSAYLKPIDRWQGQIHDTTEGRVALRTRRSLLPQIIERARQEHPYEVPSVVAVPIIDGGPDYLGWILKETEQRA